ncbi:MAG TPA: ATP-binding protein, partial [Polyangia bacterium]
MGDCMAQPPDDLLADERHLRDVVVSAINEGVVAIDAAGRFVFANEAAARLVDFPSAQALLASEGRADIFARWEVTDEAGAPIAVPDLPASRALAGEASERALRLRSRTGLPDRWLQFTATPVRKADRVALIACVFRDITEAHRFTDGQRFLAEASVALGSSLDYTATLRAVAQLAVPRLADWCAVDMKSGAGSERLAVAHVDPKKIEFAWELERRWPSPQSAPTGVPNVMRTGKPELYPEIADEMLVAGALDAEHLAVARTLGLRSAMVVPITGARGTFGVITFVSAESGRRYGDADLSLAMELAARAALAIDNAVLYADAQRAVRLRDDFLSIAGHELRTPLTALQLQLQSLVRNAKRPAAPTARELVERLEKASGHVARLERLINELLDVSRITTGRMLMHPEDVDLAALAREVVERFADDSARAQSPITLHAPAPVAGRWDRLRIDQVLTNLVANAIKYGAGKPVDVEVAQQGDRAILRVRDRGIGIGSADQQRIFGRFERAVSERHFGGLGLGLWI